MIKTITELVPERKVTPVLTKEEHTVTYTYDTDCIKDTCIDCGDKIMIDLEQNYIKHGNMCWYCHFEYYKLVTK